MQQTQQGGVRINLKRKHSQKRRTSAHALGDIPKKGPLVATPTWTSNASCSAASFNNRSKEPVPNGHICPSMMFSLTPVQLSRSPNVAALGGHRQHRMMHVGTKKVGVCNVVIAVVTLSKRGRPGWAWATPCDACGHKKGWCVQCGHCIHWFGDGLLSRSPNTAALDAHGRQCGWQQRGWTWAI
eukprot:1143188-Pelagomonas_calceolata.AAC.6